MNTTWTAMTESNQITFEVPIGSAWMPMIRDKARELLGIKEGSEPRYLAILFQPYLVEDSNV